MGLTAVVAGLLTVWAVYGAKDYGLALFVLTPIFIGANSTNLYGLKREITFHQALLVSILTLAVYMVGLLVFAIEGILCIAMAAPIGLLLTLVGSLIGYVIVKKKPGNASATMLVLVGMIPTMAFIEKNNPPTLIPVTTAMEIDADPQTVWKSIVEFSRIDEPTEFIFKTGIAYLVDAKTEGTGVGATRYCYFSTGRIVEIFTDWEESKLLGFDIIEQPALMKELSFWDVNPPHLHGYVVSKRGQFKLTELTNGNTLLEGKSWYLFNVLIHIKKKAEHKKKGGL